MVRTAGVGRVTLPTGMNTVYSSRFRISSTRCDSYITQTYRMVHIHIKTIIQLKHKIITSANWLIIIDT